MSETESISESHHSQSQTEIVFNVAVLFEYKLKEYKLNINHAR